jgi:hypothetical protein
MPSNAYSVHLQVLLRDAEELDAAHRELRTGQVGRQWGLGSLNRAVVVMCVSSWEAYVEQVLLECVELLRPAGPQLGSWPSVNAATRSAVGRFNNPNADNTRRLIAENLGLQDITTAWYWQNCDPPKARNLLNQVLTNRHEVSHGVNPRPTIHNQYSAWLPAFFRNLGRKTDAGLKAYLTGTLGLPAPW